jgi:hypothetical protein
VSFQNHKCQLQLFSPFAQLHHAVSLVLNAAAACTIFGPRSARAHHLQPPAQLGFTLPQRSLELSSLLLWCRDSTQRVQLLCFSGPLSPLASRLAGAINRRAGIRSVEHRAVTNIMKRCFDVFFRRLLTESSTS